MTVSRNINTYNDIKAQLDQAISMGGATLTLSNRNTAINWRLRAYKFRALWAKLEGERSLVPGFIPSSPYDNLLLKFDTEKEHVVHIVFRQAAGVLSPLPKAERAAQPTLVQGADPLLLEVQALMSEKSE